MSQISLQAAFLAQRTTRDRRSASCLTLKTVGAVLSITHTILFEEDLKRGCLIASENLPVRDA